MYGDQTIWLVDFLAKNNGQPDGFGDYWAAEVDKTDSSFYRDHATKETLANYAEGGSKAGSTSGNDLGGAARIGALYLFVTTEEEFAAKAVQQTAITHNNPLTLAAARFFSTVTWRAANSDAPYADIISQVLSSQEWPTEFITLIQKGLVTGTAGTDDEAAMQSYGPSREIPGGKIIYPQTSCGISSGSVSIVTHHIVKYGSLPDRAAALESALISNAMLGGDSPSRNMLIGLALGARDGFVPPARWVDALVYKVI